MEIRQTWSSSHDSWSYSVFLISLQGCCSGSGALKTHGSQSGSTSPGCWCWSPRHPHSRNKPQPPSGPTLSTRHPVSKERFIFTRAVFIGPLCVRSSFWSTLGVTSESSLQFASVPGLLYSTIPGSEPSAWAWLLFPSLCWFSGAYRLSAFLVVLHPVPCIWKRQIYDCKQGCSKQSRGNINSNNNASRICLWMMLLKIHFRESMLKFYWVLLWFFFLV